MRANWPPDFFFHLFYFFSNIYFFLSLIHSKELALTISLTRPLLGDNRVLCAIFNFPILVPLYFLSLSPPSLTCTIKSWIWSPAWHVLIWWLPCKCAAPLFFLKLIAETKRAGIDSQLDASCRPRVFFSTYLFSLAQL